MHLQPVKPILSQFDYFTTYRQQQKPGISLGSELKSFRKTVISACEHLKVLYPKYITTYRNPIELLLWIMGPSKQSTT